VNKPTDACKVLGEFDRHYTKTNAAEKARASAARAKAKCAG
jgi:hypothetical protein